MDNARAKTIPAPTGGWNARDAWADMKPNDAVVLENWYPANGEVMSRKGCAVYCDGLGGPVESLIVYHDGDSEKMIAAANGTVWDVSTSTEASLTTAPTIDRWSYATLDGVMGLVNGTDAPLTYNGTATASMTLTGPTAANVIGVNVFKSRSYFWEDESQSFWYSAINTMGGTVTEFRLGRVGNISGPLITMTSLTMDGGNGIDDLAVFIFADGDVVIYQGSDPGDANGWSLVGLYRIAAPIGRRCVMKWGGDLVVITRDGYVSLREVITERKPSISDKIRDAVRRAGELYGANTGWEPVAFHSGGFALFNVPITSTVSEQHVVNLNTGSWAKFTKWNARSWAVYKDELYFGGTDGKVYKAWVGTSDCGEAIELDAVPAFSYFGSPNLKQCTAIQPAIRYNGVLNIGLRVERDFYLQPKPIPSLSIGQSYSPWDTSPWDSTPWSRGPETYTPFKTATTVGRALSGRISANVIQHDLRWFHTTYFVEIGGFV
jgi:hypothetical protein